MTESQGYLEPAPYRTISALRTELEKTKTDLDVCVVTLKQITKEYDICSATRMAYIALNHIK